MNTKKIFVIGVLLASAFTVTAYAKSVFDIAYPISELGGCADRVACKAYCDDVAHADACFSFAKEYGIEVKTKSAQSAQIKNLPTTGPGGCKNISECRKYCDDSVNASECFKFGKEHGLISDDASQSLQPSKIEEAIKNGGPGGCKTPDGCRVYCEVSAHLDECVSFGEKNGLLSATEALRMKQEGFKAVIQQKQQGAFQGPGTCKSNDECKAYCNDPANQETCINYGVEHGFMTKAEAEHIRKLSNQIGPGGCKGEACRTYCDDQAHAEECFSFAEQNGLLSEEETTHTKEIMEVLKNGGPGGCKGKGECQAYCQAPTHHEECSNFAKEHNLIAPVEQERMNSSQKLQQAIQEQGGGPGGCKTSDECRTYCGDSSHVTECVAFGSAHNALSPEEAQKRIQDFSRQVEAGQRQFGRPPAGQNGQAQGFPGFPNSEMNGDNADNTNNDFQGQLQEFQKFEQQFRNGQNGQNGQGIQGTMNPNVNPNERGQQGQNQENHGDEKRFVGPGGCTTEAECRKYCETNPSDCSKPNGANRPAGDSNQQNQSGAQPNLGNDVKPTQPPRWINGLPNNQNFHPTDPRMMQRENQSGNQTESSFRATYGGQDMTPSQRQAQQQWQQGQQQGQTGQPQQFGGYPMGGPSGQNSPQMNGGAPQPNQQFQNGGANMPSPSQLEQGNMMPPGGQGGQMSYPPSGSSGGMMTAPPTGSTMPSSPPPSSPPPTFATPPPPPPTSFNFLKGIGSLVASVLDFMSGR